MIGTQCTHYFLIDDVSFVVLDTLIEFYFKIGGTKCNFFKCTISLFFWREKIIPIIFIIQFVHLCLLLNECLKMVLECDILSVTKSHGYFEIAALVAIILVFLQDLEQSSLKLLVLFFLCFYFGWLLYMVQVGWIGGDLFLFLFDQFFYLLLLLQLLLLIFLSCLRYIFMSYLFNFQTISFHLKLSHFGNMFFLPFFNFIFLLCLLSIKCEQSFLLIIAIIRLHGIEQNYCQVINCQIKIKLHIDHIVLHISSFLQQTNIID